MKILIETRKIKASQRYGEGIDECASRREPVEDVRQLTEAFAELKIMDIGGDQMWEDFGNINRVRNSVEKCRIGD